MDKVKMTTPDGVTENMEKLAALFPAAVTEMRGEDGTLRKGIDFEKLRQLLSRDIVEGGERYEFSWVGKKAAMAEAARPTTETLRPVKADSRDWDSTENLYIEGDNLAALKILQESYLGKVKMIYIDPPYNTGNDFIYADDFSHSISEEFDRIGILSSEENRLFRNTDGRSRFHSDWCSMIYSRLLLARNLLTDDGVIFISIDDNEQKNMKNICDEVFGEINFITMFIWEKTQHFGRQKLNSYCNSDYVFCYGKNLASPTLRELLVEKINSELLDAPLYNASNNINCLTFPTGKVKFNLSDGYYTESSNPEYELLTPVKVSNGYNENDFQLRFRSRWSNQTVQSEISKGTTFWVKTQGFAIRAIYGDGKVSNCAPRQIIFTNSNNPMCVKSRFDWRVETSENATNQLATLLDNTLFPYPKPVSLVEYLISLLYDESQKDFLTDCTILDFFSGSATTAHAVMQLNAEDGGHRKFIMVQLPEPCDEKSEAYKAGYKNICEIGKERIRRAGDKIKAEHPDADLDIGFRVFRVDSSNMRDVFYKPEEFTQTMLGEAVSNIKPDRTDLDLLYACLLDCGVPIHLPHTTTTVDGCTIHNVDNGALMACFDEHIPHSVIRAMAAEAPLQVIFRDSAFAADADKINVTEIFKNLSPDTKVRVI